MDHPYYRTSRGGANIPPPALDLRRSSRHRHLPMDTPSISFAGECDQILIITAPSALDHAAADPLRQAVADNLPNREDASVILDLHQVNLITSIGIAALLEIRERCTDHNAPLRLAALADDPRAILKLLHLESKFTYDNTVEDALAMLTR